MTAETIARWCAGMVAVVGAAYLVVLGIGITSAGSSRPIEDPGLALMEVLTLFSALPLVGLMAAIHADAPHVITLSLALAYDGNDRFAEATPLFAQGLAQSPEAWYAWGGKVGHELALGRVDEAVLAYKRWLTGMGDDGARASRLAQELRDPASRNRAIERMVQAGDVHSAVAFTRWQSGDDAVIALLERISSFGRGPTPRLLLNMVLGPKLRSDPRVRPLVAKLSAASVTK